MAATELLFETHQPDPEKGGPLVVRLSVPGEEPQHKEWTLDVSKDEALSDVLDALDNDRCDSWDDIEFVGERLWSSLTKEKVADTIGRLLKGKNPPVTHFRIRLELDKTPSLPWETLFDAQESELLVLRSHPPLFSIVHGIPGLQPPKAFARKKPADLKMLVIAPEGTGLKSRTEVGNLRAIAQRVGIGKLVVLESEVTQKAVYEQVSANDFHIIHYVGHGDLVDQRIELELNDDQGNAVPVDANRLMSSLAWPSVQLLVFNCCRGEGSPERLHSLKGLGPLALRRGVPAVVSMRYEIRDRSAILFSDAFYRSLFGDSRGQVDLAMSEARRVLDRDSGTPIQTFALPLLHVARGCEELIYCSELAGSDRLRIKGDEPDLSEVNDASPAILPARTSLPPSLREALRTSQCVLVLGPAVLHLDEPARRSAANANPNAIPTILQLVETLGSDTDWPYPEQDEIKKARHDTPTEWQNPVLLQRICQHLSFQQDQAGARVGLTRMEKALAQAYENAVLPATARALIQRRFQGVFYTWFDGLFHQQALSGNSALSDAWCSLDKAFSAKRLGGKHNPLILLRGSIKTPDTLVVTESDHEELSSILRGTPAALAGVAAAASKSGKYSVLIIGASPRDPVVRQTCRILFQKNLERAQEGRYFVCPMVASADRAFWARYRISWIESEIPPALDAVVEAPR